MSAVGDQAAELGRVRVGVEIEHHPALRRVVVPPPEAALGVDDVVGERPVGAARVTAGRLDHHDVGTEIAEQLAGMRGVLARELDDTNTVQRTGQRIVTHMTPSRSSSSMSASERPSTSCNTRRLCSPEARGAALDHPVGLGEVDGDAVDAHVADLAVVNRGPEAPLARGRVVIDAVLRVARPQPPARRRRASPRRS